MPVCYSSNEGISLVGMATDCACKILANMEQKDIEDVLISTILPKPGFATTGPGTLVAVEVCDGMAMFLSQRTQKTTGLRVRTGQGQCFARIG